MKIIFSNLEEFNPNLYPINNFKCVNFSWNIVFSYQVKLRNHRFQSKALNKNWNEFDNAELSINADLLIRWKFALFGTGHISGITFHAGHHRMVLSAIYEGKLITGNWCNQICNSATYFQAVPKGVNSQ